MSRSSPSLLGLLGILQRHGLTYAQLAAFVAACQAQHSGPVVFRLTQGRIRGLDVQSPRQLPQRYPSHD
jgi:hypothetical protein